MSRAVKRNFLAILTIVMWSTAFSGTRFIAGALSASVIAFVRVLAAAALLMIIWALRKDRRVPTLKDLPWFVLAGAAGFAFYLILFSLGMRTITGAESSVIIAITPVLVAVFSSFLFKEHLNKWGWFSTIGAFIGVAILMLWGSGLNIQVGMIWTLIASVLFAIYNITNRILSGKGYSSIDIVAFAMVISVVLLIWILPQAIREVSTASIIPVVATVYMGFVPSAIAYAVWGAAISLADKTSEVTNYMFVTPLFATIEGIIFLNEVPDMGTYIGGGLIIIMVVLFNMTKKS